MEPFVYKVVEGLMAETMFFDDCTFVIRERPEEQGITECSERLFDKTRNKFKRFVKATMEKRNSNERYLILRDEEGNQLHLTGCTSGYGGTGPMGTLYVLNRAGFNIDARYVISAKEFELLLPEEYDYIHGKTARLGKS